MVMKFSYFDSIFLYICHTLVKFIHAFITFLGDWQLVGWLWIRCREKPSSDYPQSQSLLFRFYHYRSTPFKGTDGLFVLVLLSWWMTTDLIDRLSWFCLMVMKITSFADLYFPLVFTMVKGWLLPFNCLLFFFSHSKHLFEVVLSYTKFYNC